MIRYRKKLFLAVMVLFTLPFVIPVARAVQQTVDVILFYPKDGTQNQSGDPNWYFFWSQALGVTGQHTYNGGIVTSQTLVTGCNQWTIQIGGNASWPDPDGNPPTGHRYIDGFWATNEHEFWHRDHRNHNHCVHGHHGGGNDPLPMAVDPDQDGICNDWEAMIGTNPNIPTDTEIGAEWAEQNPRYGHYYNDALDWAYPGSQRE